LFAFPTFTLKLLSGDATGLFGFINVFSREPKILKNRNGTKKNVGLMKSKILTINKKINKFKKNSNKRQLELNNEEYQTLKDALIPRKLHKTCEVLNYRGIPIKVINEEKNE